MNKTTQQITPPRNSKDILCAIYTRKSTDENMGAGFTSLDSQKTYCQTFIKSRAGEGWRICREKYDDLGFSGGNMGRPGLKRLLADAKAKKFHVVVCYKYDRLSRSTRDFLHILDLFDQHGVHFVSVTQPIDTTSSVGRLMRSILMDFAQFEREIISERTRDKMAAMAKRGQWLGSHPVLGYDYNPEEKRLRVNQKEAKQVQELFETYLHEGSLQNTAEAINEKGYRMKIWISRQGRKKKGGSLFHKANLFYLLTNPIYTGKIRYRGRLYKGAHPAIVREDVFKKVQQTLKANLLGRTFRRRKDGRPFYLLQKIFRCGSCHSAMTPNIAYSKGKPFYYYKCLSVIKRGRASECTVRNISAPKIERSVLERLSFLTERRAIRNRVVREILNPPVSLLESKVIEKKGLLSKLSSNESSRANLVHALAHQGPSSEHGQLIMNGLKRLNSKRAELQAQADRLADEISSLEERKMTGAQIRVRLKDFKSMFHTLSSTEQRELIHQVVKKAVCVKAKDPIQIQLCVREGASLAAQPRILSLLVNAVVRTNEMSSDKEKAPSIAPMPSPTGVMANIPKKGRLPFGEKKTANGRGIHQRESKWLQKIWELSGSGYSDQEIADWMNSRDQSSRRAGKWCRVAIWRVRCRLKSVTK
ncbi:MAG: recombinase family protein [Elusimicrobia bacterium]|nr:recombinase family protein [Elusimicrobiota bacterium]